MWGDETKIEIKREKKKKSRKVVTLRIPGTTDSEVPHYYQIVYNPTDCAISKLLRDVNKMYHLCRRGSESLSAGVQFICLLYLVLLFYAVTHARLLCFK